jgi:putative transposase
MVYQISERRACHATGFARASQRYKWRRDPQVALRIRLKDLAAVAVRYGYRRLHVLVRREGWPVNRKRIYRVGRPAIGAPNDVWATDFMSDALFDGRPFRFLTVVDCCSREGLATVPRANFRAFHVVEVLDDSSLTGASRRPFASTTAQSSPDACSTSGPI